MLRIADHQRNINKKHHEVSLHTICYSSEDKDEEKLELCSSVDGNINWCNNSEK